MLDDLVRRQRTGAGHGARIAIGVVVICECLFVFVGAGVCNGTKRELRSTPGGLSGGAVGERIKRASSHVVITFVGGLDMVGNICWSQIRYISVLVIVFGV